MGRGAFLGLAGLGVIAATAGSARAGTVSGGEYTGRVRPPAGLGLGKGEAASLSVVWLPAEAGAQLPPLKVRPVIFDLGGKPLAEQEVRRGAARGDLRRLRVSNVSSGQSKLAVPGVIP